MKPWKLVGRRSVYQRDPALLREDEQELPDGSRRIYPALQLGGSVGILPFLSPGEVVLVRQYRHLTGDFCWEVPGGSLLPGETPEQGAQRELREESGYRAGTLRRLGAFWPNNAYLDEVIHVFLADALVEDPLPADPDEQLDRQVFSFAEALAMARDDRITCGLTKLALFWAALEVRREVAGMS